MGNRTRAIILMISAILMTSACDDDEPRRTLTEAEESQLKLEALGTIYPDPVSDRDRRLREQLVRDACRISVKNQLKDPDSAQFRNEEVSAADETYEEFTVTGEWNANNSFGGKVGSTPYTCTATYDTEDETARGLALIDE